MASKNCDSGDNVKEKFSKIHEMVGEALAKMQDLAASLQQDDRPHAFENVENVHITFRSFQDSPRPISSESQLTSNRPFTEESHYIEAPFIITKDSFGEHMAEGNHELLAAGFEDENDRISVSTASSLFNVPHRAWEVDLFLKDAELSVEKRMESQDDGMFIEGWIDDLKVQRLKLTAAQRETAMEGRRGIEAVRKVQERLAAIEAAFSQSQKREPATMGSLAAMKEELTLLQSVYRKCAVEKHALSLQLNQDQEIRAEEIKKLNAAFDSMILRHKAEVSSLRLENTRMKNSYERNIASLKDELNFLLETRIPREQFQQVEKQIEAFRIAAEEAQKESLHATRALSAERQCRLEEMQQNDQNELRAQQNIKLWQTRCRQLDSSLNTVMTAYERANLDWPFDEHFQVIDLSKDPAVAVALPPTPAMLALAAEKQRTQNYVFNLEREIGELRAENERLHSNYATSILQNDEDRLKIDNLNAEIKKIAVEKDTIQKKAKSSIAIASAKSKAATPKESPVVVQWSSTETQTDEIELTGNELKEFQNNQRLQSVAGLMLRQLESRSEANRVLQQSVEDAATGINKSLIEGEYIKNETLQFMSRIQKVLESLVHQNTQLRETSSGERSLLLQRLQQALSSNDCMRREIDYLKCMSSNVFCEVNNDDPTLGPLMNQHSVSIQTDLESDQKMISATTSATDITGRRQISASRVSGGKPVIPSRKAMMCKEMLQLRSAMMAWMASTVSKTFCAWKNFVWFGDCEKEKLHLDGTTMIVEIQQCGASIAQRITEVAVDIQMVCMQWSSALQQIADIIAKEKAIKDLGDKFFSNGNQIKLMMSLSEQVTSFQYQSAFQTLQEDLMDDHKDILLSARRSDEAVADLKVELASSKTRNMEIIEETNILTKLVEELQKKLTEEETRQLEWSTHVESTADVWAHQLAKLAQQDKALFEQNEALRKMLIDSMTEVKTPLPALVPFENIAFNVGASSLCSCDGCSLTRKRLEVVRSGALHISAKFSSQKRAVFKGADAFLKGKSNKEAEISEKSPKGSTISPVKPNDVIHDNNDDAVSMLNSNGAQRTTLRIFKYQAKISKLETENVKLKCQIDELQLLNDYLRAKFRNEDEKIMDRPGTVGLADLKSSHSLQSSRQMTPRSPAANSPFKNCSAGEILLIDTTSTISNPGIASLNSTAHMLQADPNTQISLRIPRLIKSAGSDKQAIEDSFSSQTQTLDIMLDAAHKKIDEMHREISNLREKSQAHDKKSIEEIIARAVKSSNLKMMTQAEHQIKLISDLKFQLSEKENQATFEKQKAAAEFEAHRLLLSQQLSSARMEMSRRAGKTIELRQKLEIEVETSRSREAALESAQRSKEIDSKTIQELKDQLSQLQITAAVATEQAQEAISRTHDKIILEIEAHQNIEVSERERELFGQLSASEQLADAAVSLSRHLLQLLENIDRNGGSINSEAADAIQQATKIGIELPNLFSSTMAKKPSVTSPHLTVNFSIEREEVYNRRSPQVSKQPVHRSDNALALLKLVDSDFEDMQLVKSAMKRIQLRPVDGFMQQSPRNPVSARVLRPSKQTQDKIAAKPHPPHVHLRE